MNNEVYKPIVYEETSYRNKEWWELKNVINPKTTMDDIFVILEFNVLGNSIF